MSNWDGMPSMTPAQAARARAAQAAQPSSRAPAPASKPATECSGYWGNCKLVNYGPSGCQQNYIYTEHQACAKPEKTPIICSYSSCGTTVVPAPAPAPAPARTPAPAPAPAPATCPNKFKVGCYNNGIIQRCGTGKKQYNKNCQPHRDDNLSCSDYSECKDYVLDRPHQKKCKNCTFSKDWHNKYTLKCDCIDDMDFKSKQVKCSTNKFKYDFDFETRHIGKWSLKCDN